MARYGYVRISTTDQKTDRQMDAFLKYGVDKKKIFIDKTSGKDFNRPAYKRMIGKLRKGDVLIIKSIDRLGRNYAEILDEWRKLTKDIGVDIEVVDMPLLNTAVEQNGLTGVFISDLVLQILAYVAETERTFIRQRQKEGIASARQRGVKFGRQRVAVSEDFDIAYEKWIAHELSSREAAELVGMSHTTFYRRCRERIENQ